MDQAERVMLIRRGNELFNQKDYKNALKIFIAVSYSDGIARVASILEHEKKDRVAALKLYKTAGMKGNVEKLAYEMAQAIRLLIKEDHVKDAHALGKNFNTGYKISGQAPEMMPHEVVKLAKQKLGINSSIASFPEKESNAIPWKPITISRTDLRNLDKINRNKK